MLKFNRYIICLVSIKTKLTETQKSVTKPYRSTDIDQCPLAHCPVTVVVVVVVVYFITNITSNYRDTDN